jgi:tetratricopeptide (TPR) repeat protein
MADQPRQLAEAAAASGDLERAYRILLEAARHRSSDAAMWNSAGNSAMRAGLAGPAAEAFAQAVQLAPGALEFSINHSIALGRMGEHEAALGVLAKHEDAGKRDVRYCSVRAASSLALGERGEAARWYDAALALDFAHPRATLGRARVALERGENDAVARFDAAISANPTDPECWLGKAQALEAAGRAGEAAQLASALTAQAPHWLDALSLEAMLLVAGGERDFSRPFAAAAARLPQDPNIPAAHCEILAGMDRFDEAAEIAAAARERFPGVEEFALLEAQHAGAAGDDERAGRLWREIGVRGPRRDLLEARHRLRLRDPAAAEHLLGLVLDEDPWNVTAWAMRGVAWRLLDDPRHEWLHGQEGLVRLLPLNGAAAIMPEVVPLLHALHDGSARPLGQSLRGGTQTRGGLFDRQEPALVRLRDAIVETLADYRAQLPPVDDAHPLLRHRDDAWKIAGSWSVRLAGGGDYHTSHIHPQGIVSSALYLELPPDVTGEDRQAGWLEIGRPAADLRLDLPPLEVIRPEPGHLALFPSTLFHGTRPFSQRRRMTVAFDVHARHPQ